LAKAAGATYVARGTAAQGLILEKLIAKGLEHKGMSVIEAISDCPVQFGRRNRLSDPVEMLHWIRDHGVPVARAAKMNAEELDGKFVTGELHCENRPEYCEEYAKLREEVQKTKKAASTPVS